MSETELENSISRVRYALCSRISCIDSVFGRYAVTAPRPPLSLVPFLTLQGPSLYGSGRAFQIGRRFRHRFRRASAFLRKVFCLSLPLPLLHTFPHFLSSLHILFCEFCFFEQLHRSARMFTALQRSWPS